MGAEVNPGRRGDKPGQRLRNTHPVEPPRPIGLRGFGELRPALRTERVRAHRGPFGQASVLARLHQHGTPGHPRVAETEPNLRQTELAVVRHDARAAVPDRCPCSRYKTQPLFSTLTSR